MSLDKAIKHGKERRKPYTGSKAIDGTCRNHGGCPWGEENRKHKVRDKHPPERDDGEEEVTWMPDREKVVGHLNDCMEASRRDNTWVFVRKDIIADVLALLKEQEAEIDEVSDEYIDLGKEMAKQPKIVRCKDCKYGYHLLDTKKGVIIKYRIACLKHPELMQSPDWFCADGERSE